MVGLKCELIFNTDSLTWLLIFFKHLASHYFQFELACFLFLATRNEAVSKRRDMGEYLPVPAEKRDGLASEHGANDDVKHTKISQVM